MAEVDVYAIGAILKHNREVVESFGQDHAAFSPSSINIKLACPLSFSLSEGVDDKTNEAAERGTLMHYISEELLLNGEYPTLEDDIEPLNREEIDIVETYVEFAQSIIDRAVWYAVECKVIINPLCWGTADLMALVEEEGKIILYVIDLKTGFLTVKANSTQLKTYALGAYKAVRDVVEIDEVEAVIIQPRDEEDPVKQHTYDIKEVAAFEHIINRAVDEALSANPPWSVGEHCRWCPASPTCPKINLSLKSVIDDAYIPLHEALSMATVAENWAKRVKQRAIDMLDDGREVKGWKLVKGRSTRKWKETEALYGAMDALFGEEAYERKYLTPSQAEKALKPLEIRLDESPLGEYVVKSEGKPQLAPESDKRETVKSEDLFEVIK